MKKINLKLVIFYDGFKGKIEQTSNHKYLHWLTNRKIKIARGNFVL
tara:strand:+ start:249 stop:386 length:138 start_codon:yes stop_codon:yes gene_type:complete